MKRFLICLLLCLFQFVSLRGQIEIIKDDQSSDFFKEGKWMSLKGSKYFGGEALKKRKGDGSAYAGWEVPVQFPGRYEIYFHVVEGKYAKDTHCRIKSGVLDTLVLQDQFKKDGWLLLGEFELNGPVNIAINDKSENEDSKYVLVDGVKLVSALKTFPVQGRVNWINKKNNPEIDIWFYSINKELSLYHEKVSPGTDNFTLDGILEGEYNIIASAPGYDSMELDSVKIGEDELNELNLTFQAKDLERGVISGKLSVDGQCETAEIVIGVYSTENGKLVHQVEVSLNGNYSLSDLPLDDYRLIFSGYKMVTDSTTFAYVQLNDGSVELPELVLYPYFDVAWITDTHIGVSGNNAAMRNVLNDIVALEDTVDFVINTGDLTEKGLNHEYAEYFGVLADYPSLKTWNVPGNHDTKWSESGLEIHRKYAEERHFSFQWKGFNFFGINSGIPMRGGGGYFMPEEVEWLKSELEGMDDPNAPVILCWHHPATPGSISNYWQVVDILKEYNTVLVLVGHGHYNHVYNYEGVPSLMSVATFGNGEGFNLIRFSKKEITVQTHYQTGEKADFAKIIPKKPLSLQMEFKNFQENDIFNGEGQIEFSVIGDYGKGICSIDGVKSYDLEKSGNYWKLGFNSAIFDNGYHTLKFTMTDADGNSRIKTVSAIFENGDPRALWRFQSGSSIITAPAYDDDNVYVGALDGRLIGLDRETGKRAWPDVATGGSVLSSPVVIGNSVYFGSSDYHLYGVNVNTGKVVLNKDYGDAILSPITEFDSVLYFGVNNTLKAFSLKTGEDIWEYATGGMIESKPLVYDSTLYITSWDGNLYAIDLRDHDKKWGWKTQSSFYYAPGACWPVANDHFVFVSDPKRFISCVGREDGATVWRANDPETWESIGISEDQSKVYTRTLYGQIAAYSATDSTREEVWFSQVSNEWDSSPSMIREKDGVVFSGSCKGYVTALSSSSGEELWKYWISKSYIATITPISSRRVLAAAMDGTVICINSDVTAVHEKEDKKALNEDVFFNPYPNPFSDHLVFPFSLRNDCIADINIYNIIGEEIWSSSGMKFGKGKNQFLWNGKNKRGEEVCSGVYFISIEYNDRRIIKKTLKIK